MCGWQWPFKFRGFKDNTRKANAKNSRAQHGHRKIGGAPIATIWCLGISATRPRDR
jgi:hypothetical protein